MSTDDVSASGSQDEGFRPEVIVPPWKDPDRRRYRNAEEVRGVARDLAEQHVVVEVLAIQDGRVRVLDEKDYDQAMFMWEKGVLLTRREYREDVQRHFKGAYEVHSGGVAGIVKMVLPEDTSVASAIHTLTLTEGVGIAGPNYVFHITSGGAGACPASDPVPAVADAPWPASECGDEFSGEGVRVVVVDTGFDACTTASNHTIDKGFPGIQRTLDAMDAAGLKHAGSNRSAQEEAGTTMLDAHGVKVALLAYAYGLNGFQLPADKTWAVDIIDTAKILADAHAARAAGAQIVLVALHAGSEYQILPTAAQREVATALAASPDIDLIYGHHAHVVQPFDKVGTTWVAYGLGNMLAHQHRLPKLVMAQHEVMAEFTFALGSDGRWAVAKAEARPAAMSNLDEPLRYIDLATLLADPTVSEARKAAYRPFYDRAVASLTKLGADTKGLVIAGR